MCIYIYILIVGIDKYVYISYILYGIYHIFGRIENFKTGYLAFSYNN